MNDQAKYLARMAVLLVVLMGTIHIAWTAMISTAISYYYHARIFDIHRIGHDDERTWMAAYIESTVSDDMVLAAGSSFTFLYPFDETYTFTSELNRRGIESINISATGYGSRDMHNAILCPLIKQGKRPRAIVLELSLINEVSSMRELENRAAVGDCPSIASSGLFLFTLMHPLGKDWISIAKDQFRHVAPPDKPSLGVVPDSYFPTMAAFEKAKPILESNIKRLYARAKSISENVSIFVTPVYFDGVTVVGRDADMVRLQYEATLALCKRTAGLDCLDTSSLTNERYFANVTHFNANGARALAEMIEARLR